MRNIVKNLFQRSILLILVAVTATSCFNEKQRNYQYFPNMYQPVSYEAYGAYDVFVNEQEAKLPVEGTVARGWKPFGYENSNEGHELAEKELKNPIPYTEENLAEGQQLYTIYCAVCHGDKGDGNGILSQREKILGIPAYNDPNRNITEGMVYWVMYYGKNAMGSYASQTSIRERWQIDHYVMSLKNSLDGKPERAYEMQNDSIKELTESQLRVQNKKELVPAVNAEPTVRNQEGDAQEPNQVEESTNQN